MEVDIRVGADLCSQVEHMSVKLVRIETYVQQHRHYLLSVSTDSQAELMYRAFLAVYHEVERLVLAEKLVCDIIICLCSIYLGHNMVQVIHAYLLTVFEMKPVLEQFLLTRQHSPDVHIGDHQRVCCHSQCRFLRHRRIFARRPGRDFAQQRILSCSSLIATHDHGVYADRIETHHVVFPEHRLDLDIRYIHIPVKGVAA